MASTYTSRIRLVKQGDGDNPNSWGAVLNDGVISLVDDAIAAYGDFCRERDKLGNISNE